MKMSTKGRYAVRILLSIARNQKSGPVSKKVIAADEGISADYIEQIIVPLKNEGFVIGLRGVKGGFILAKDPASINVCEILRVSEGGCELVDCQRNDCGGRDKNLCVTRPIWEKACKLLEDYFSTITIRDLMDRAAECERIAASNYTI